MENRIENRIDWKRVARSGGRDRTWEVEWLIAKRISLEDVLPTVCNGDIPAHTNSKIRSPFKIPTCLTRDRGSYVGIPGWVKRITTDLDIERWAVSPDIGIMLRGVNQLALDVDCENEEVIEALHCLLCNFFGVSDLPYRWRENSNRRLYLISKDFTVDRQIIKVPEGYLEVLGDRQVFQIFGVHKSGVLFRYEDNPLPKLKYEQYKYLQREINQAFKQGFMPTAPNVTTVNSVNSITTVETINVTTDKAKNVLDLHNQKKVVIQDEEYKYIKASPLYIRVKPDDGALYIRCPKIHMHTNVDADTDCVYYPSYELENGVVSKPKFHCFHTSCNPITHKDFVLASGALMNRKKNTTIPTASVSASASKPAKDKIDKIDKIDIVEYKEVDTASVSTTTVRKIDVVRGKPPETVPNIIISSSFNKLKRILRERFEDFTGFNPIAPLLTPLDDMYFNSVSDKVCKALIASKIANKSTSKIAFTVENISFLCKLTNILDFTILRDRFSSQLFIDMGGDRYCIKDVEQQKYLRDMLCKYFNFTEVSTKRLYETLDGAQSRYFDSASDWIKEVEWDGIDRLSTLSENMFVLNKRYNSNEQVNCYFKYYFSSAAGRLLNETTVTADKVIVLCGKQGTGKSAFLKVLNPISGFYSTMLMKLVNKDVLQALSSTTLIELAEIGGANTEDIDSAWKNLISAEYDYYRPYYMPNHQRFNRRALILATSNNKRFLTDPSGNRRWLPITVDEPINIEYLMDNKRQLFAQGLQLYLDKSFNISDTDNYTEFVSKQFGVETQELGILEEYIENKIKKLECNSRAVKFLAIPNSLVTEENYLDYYDEIQECIDRKMYKLSMSHFIDLNYPRGARSLEKLRYRVANALTQLNWVQNELIGFHFSTPEAEEYYQNLVTNNDLSN